MDPRRNPYTPNAGAMPQALVGRDTLIDDFAILLDRLKDGRSSPSMLVTGFRGVGKTVLLTKFEDIANEKCWRVFSEEISSTSTVGSIVAVRAREVLLALSLSEMAKDVAFKALRVLKAFTLRLPEGPELSIDIEAAFGIADSGDLAHDLSDLLIEVGRAVKANDTGFVLILDEVQFLPKKDLEALIVALHAVTRKKLPVTVVAAGLPNLRALAGEAKRYAERLFEMPSIGRLEAGVDSAGRHHDYAREALLLPAQSEGVEYTEDACKRVLAVTEGYPYFIQAYGKHCWNLAPTSPITLRDVEMAIPLAETALDEGFFAMRTSAMTDDQWSYLHAMARLGEAPYTSERVAKEAGYKDQRYGSPMRDSLIDAGLIYAPRRGFIDFTVPQFTAYLGRLSRKTRKQERVKRPR